MFWEYLDEIFSAHSFFIISVALVIIWLSLRYAWPSSDGKPPGPWSLPVIGNIFLFGKAPHKNVTRLAQHYGRIFSMKLGSREVIILNDIDTVKEALTSRLVLPCTVLSLQVEVRERSRLPFLGPNTPRTNERRS